jgi:hypothetical protein
MQTVETVRRRGRRADTLLKQGVNEKVAWAELALGRSTG